MRVTMPGGISLEVNIFSDHVSISLWGDQTYEGERQVSLDRLTNGFLRLLTITPGPTDQHEGYLIRSAIDEEIGPFLEQLGRMQKRCEAWRGRAEKRLAELEKKPARQRKKVSGRRKR